MALGGPGGPTPPPGQRLPRSALVTRGREIRALLAGGRRHPTRVLDVFVGASPAGRPRLGVVVPRAGRRIVERNRLKRRLREIGRIRVLPTLFRAGRREDVLVRARPLAYEATWAELESELMGVVEGICSRRS